MDGETLRTLINACIGRRLYKFDENVKNLLKKGICANIEYGAYVSPMHAAVNGKNIDAIQYFISSEGGYDIDTVICSEGNTMLTTACGNNDKDVVEFLLQQGSSIHPNSTVGPIDCLDPDDTNSVAIAKLFLKYGLDLDKLRICDFTDEVWQELEGYSDSISACNIKPAKTKS